MNLEYLPKKLREKVMALMNDDAFQKIYSEDKILDELDEERKQHPEKNDEIYEKMNYRSCQLVANYLVDTGRVGHFHIKKEKLKEMTKDVIILLLR